MRKSRNIAAMCAVIMTMVFLTACSGTEESKDIYTLEPEALVTESLNLEPDKELQETESQETGFTEDTGAEESLNVGEDTEVSDEREDAGQSVDEAANNYVDKTTNAVEEPVASSEDDVVPPETTETPPTNQQTQNISVPATTIVGSISSLGSGSFSISRANINSNVMVSTDETVNVVYSDSTEFEVCTSTDGGITASFAAGTSADLQAGRLVDIEGAYEGSDFVAQKITMRIFG